MKKTFVALILLLSSTILFAKTITVVNGSGVNEIQSAINSAKKGDIVIIKSGFYETTAKLQIEGKSGITIQGEGQVDIVCNLLAHVIEIKNSDNIILENLHMVHSIYMNSENAQCGETANVIEIENSDFITVKKCELNGCGYIGVNAKDCPNLTVTDSYIHSNTYYGIIYMVENKKSGLVVIKNNRMINNHNPIFYKDMDVNADIPGGKELIMSGNLIYPGPTLTW